MKLRYHPTSLSDGVRDGVQGISYALEQSDHCHVRNVVASFVVAENKVVGNDLVMFRLGHVQMGGAQRIVEFVSQASEDLDRAARR